MKKKMITHKISILSYKILDGRQTLGQNPQKVKKKSPKLLTAILFDSDIYS